MKSNEPERDWARTKAESVEKLIIQKAVTATTDEVWLDNLKAVAIIAAALREAQGQPALDVVAVSREIADEVDDDHFDGHCYDYNSLLAAIQAIISRHFRADESRAVLERVRNSLECIQERAAMMKGKASGGRPQKSATQACAWIEGEAIGALALLPEQRSDRKDEL